MTALDFACREISAPTDNYFMHRQPISSTMVLSSSNYKEDAITTELNDTLNWLHRFNIQSSSTTIDYSAHRAINDDLLTLTQQHKEVAVAEKEEEGEPRVDSLLRNECLRSIIALAWSSCNSSDSLTASSEPAERTTRFQATQTSPLLNLSNNSDAISTSQINKPNSMSYKDSNHLTGLDSCSSNSLEIDLCRQSYIRRRTISSESWLSTAVSQGSNASDDVNVRRKSLSSLHSTKSNSNELTSTDFGLLPPNAFSTNENHLLAAQRRPMQVHLRQPVPREEDAIYNARYKTKPCLHYQRHRRCPLGNNCHFAHGPLELKHAITHPKYRTRMCKNFQMTGLCDYGDKCFFVHSTVKQLTNTSEYFLKNSYINEPFTQVKLATDQQSVNNLKFERLPYL